MEKDYHNIANLCYEIGTLRRINRSHRQHFLTADASDNIGSHSHRVACIAFMLAQLEGVDPYKTAVMALFHDVPETRSGDQNWVHKRYVTAHEDEVVQDQFGSLPFDDLSKVVAEYRERTSPESIVAKDADLLDQILLLKEYAWSGNKEADLWLKGKDQDQNKHLSLLRTESGKKVGACILDGSPSDWWNGLSTSENRT
ncbi:HD domain-containing protein [Patescibacteria group bacterium]|nr:HD domain-containing protein [Patescibacteria group bacterium]